MNNLKFIFLVVILICICSGVQSQNVGIGVDTPKTPLAIMAPTGLYQVGITQNQVGGQATMELTTEDSTGTPATRLLLRGGANPADVEFYRGARGLEELSMMIDGATGNVGIGTANPSKALEVVGNALVTGNFEMPNGKLGLGLLNPTRTLHVSGNSLLQGTLEVESNLVLGGNLTTEGDADIKGSMDIEMDLKVFDNLTVVNDLISLGNIDIGNSSGSLDIEIGTSPTNAQDQTFTTTSLLGKIYLPKVVHFDSNPYGLGISESNWTIQDEGSGIGFRHINGDNFFKIFTNGKIFFKLMEDIGDFKNVQYNDATGELGYDNSSRRYKENIKPLNDDYYKILNLEPKKYTRPNRPSRYEIGYIAEEAAELDLEYLITRDREGIPDNFNYEKMVLYLNEVVKDQQKTIELLQKKIKDIERSIEN